MRKKFTEDKNLYENTQTLQNRTVDYQFTGTPLHCDNTIFGN